MATVTTTVTGYNIKSGPAAAAAEKVTSFMTSCDDVKQVELVRKSSGASRSGSRSSVDETPQHSHFVVVGVDFGTAYSGYAFR